MRDSRRRFHGQSPKLYRSSSDCFLLPTQADIQAAAQNAYDAFVDDLSAQLDLHNSSIAKDKTQSAQIISDISLRLRHLDLTPQASAVRADIISQATAFIRGIFGRHTVENGRIVATRGV